MTNLSLKSFYFIRHGETDWNYRNIIMGQTDIPLNKRGIEQAIEARSLLKNIHIGSIYTSPLKRAVQTAEIVNQALKYPINLSEGLKERNWGEKEGKTHNISLTAITDLKLPKGAEKWEDFELRTLLTIQQILNSSLIPPLIVAHGGIFVVLAKYFGMPSLRANNCSVYLFRAPDIEGYPWFICNLTDEDENFNL